MKKYTDKVEDQLESLKMQDQPEWVKFKEPSLKTADLEGAAEQIRSLKVAMNQLIEQRSLFKVASEKYKARAFEYRKKYQDCRKQFKILDKNVKTDDIASIRLANTNLKQ